MDVVKKELEETLQLESIALHLDELKEITDNFGSKSHISGRVYHGVLKSGQAAAIKIFSSSAQSEPDEDFLAQVSMISRLKHDHIVEVIGNCIDGGQILVAYEYASNGSLWDMLHGNPVLSWDQRVEIAVGAAKGLEYLHKTARIIHGDIKSSNILIFDNHVAKIADFGLRKKFLHMPNSNDSNLGYHAPEYDSLTGQLDSKSDVYSFGVVLFELLTGRKPHDNTLEHSQQHLVTWSFININMARPKFNEDKANECVDIRLNGEYSFKAVTKMAEVATLCVRYDPTSRPDMSSVVQELLPFLNPHPPTHPVVPNSLVPPASPPPFTHHSKETSHWSSFMCCWRTPT
ncbi:LOW QUALITY PROTEIN: hypothetical protein M8C21_000356 [Ambrosia artemisiifolia]|uniref:Protein kinase domain-containing protein n=1 Tax=Ambrosia artemisiifolia TaxID=4212 RepID=A0AAD5BTB7_AMBAR|nr:LOW QUALITY PROTEIN: hypothetical protein M8C21_000356 [Ambrosia artemisiifolia]